MKILHRVGAHIRPRLLKAILVMKMIAFLLLVALTQVSAAGYGQSVTLKEKNASIEKVLRSIASQSGYNFLYDRKDLPQDGKVTVNLVNASVDEALRICLKGQPVSYKIIQQTIVLKKAAPVVEEEKPAPAPPVKITGRITDDKGAPLQGAGVEVNGTSTRTSTDVNGSFSITVPNENSVLLISYVGFARQEVSVKGKTSVDIKMLVDDGKLTDMVIVGYGTQRKSTLTGAVSVIDSKQLENRPVTSVATALQGLASGLTVTRETGQPGEEGIGIQVRGATSANAGVEALVILDGVTVPSITLQTMNPNDIESISVLKDAAAASIYGAQSAGGVIVITTKKGRNGKTVFEYSNNIGVDWGLNIPKRLSLLDEALFANVARANSGQGPEYSAADLDRIRAGVEYIQDPADSNNYVYYNQKSLIDVIMRRQTTTQTHNLTARGGTDKFNFLLGAGFYDKEGIFKVGPDQNRRYNIRFNTVAQLTNHLSLDSRITYTLQQIQSASTLINGNGADGGTIYEIYRLRQRNPYFTPEGRYNARGPATYARLEAGGFNELDRNFFDGVFTFKLANLIKGLQLRAVYGTQYRFSDRNTFVRSVPVWNKVRITGTLDPTNSYTVYDEKIRNNNLQFLGDYDYKIGTKHKFHLLAGYQFEDNRFEAVTSRATALISNDNPALNFGDERTKTANGTVRSYAYQSGFGRFNYSYDDKYLFEATVRVDESSRLAPGMRVKTFPSVSAGWNLHNETFFEKALPFFSQFKLRGSWGTLGNAQGIGNWDFLNTLNRASNLVLGDVRTAYLSQTSIPSLDLSWETIETLNGGIDFGFFGNKLQASADYYVKHNRNMLLRIELPDVLGIQTPRKNAATLKTWGWDVDLKWNSGIGKDFRYSVGLNVSDNQNRITSYEGGNVVKAGVNTQPIQGYSINSFFGYHTNGYYSSLDDAKAGVIFFNRVDAGDVRYIDQNGDGRLSIGAGTTADFGDLKYLGTTDPRYLFGFNFGANWKGIDFSMFWQGVGKRNFMPNPRSLMPYREAWMQALTVHTNYWTPENQAALYPRPYYQSTHNYNPSDKWFLDGRYIRLKNVQLGYSLSPKLISKVKLTRARLFITAQDILTFSKLGNFKGYYDPEMRNGVENDYPFFATAAVGINLGF